MKFSLDVDQKKYHIEFSRNSFTGRATLTVNAQSMPLTSPGNLSTHFSFQLVRRYETTVGDEEKHQVVIEHERPRLLGGFRRHRYRVYVDGSVVAEHYGF